MKDEVGRMKRRQRLLVHPCYFILPSFQVGMPAWTPFARRDSPVAGDLRLWRSCLPLAARTHPRFGPRGHRTPIAKPPSVTAPKEAVCYPSIDGSPRSSVGKTSRFERSIGPPFASRAGVPSAPIRPPEGGIGTPKIPRHGLRNASALSPRRQRGPLRADAPCLAAPVASRRI